MARPSLLRKKHKTPTASKSIHADMDVTITKDEVAAHAAIDAHGRVMAVIKEFVAENRTVFTEFAELCARAEAAEAVAKKALAEIDPVKTWQHGHVKKNVRPTTPVFALDQLPPPVLLTPGVIKSVDHKLIEKMATGTLAAYAAELAAAKIPNPKPGSVTFTEKTPLEKDITKLL